MKILGSLVEFRPRSSEIVDDLMIAHDLKCASRSVNIDFKRSQQFQGNNHDRKLSKIVNFSRSSKSFYVNQRSTTISRLPDRSIVDRQIHYAGNRISSSKFTTAVRTALNKTSVISVRSFPFLSVPFLNE